MTESDTDDVINFTIPGDYSKARAIRFVISEMDRVYSERSVSTLPVDRSEVDEDPDVRADTGERTSTDESESDSELGGTPEDSGVSSSQTESDRGSPDEGASDEPDLAQVETSGVDVESTPAERTEEESGQSEREREPVAFHFAPGIHSRGDLIN